MIPASFIASVLEELESSGAPAVARFDRGRPLTGDVVVLPSAFNPPTIAHLELLALAREATGAGHAAALLSTRNVDKDLHGASLPHRVAMLLAVADRGARHAVLAATPARIADQGAALRSHFPGARFDFVAGHDTLIRLFDPRYYEDMAATMSAFFAHHRLVATNRGAAGVTAVMDFIEFTPAARDFRDRILVRELHEHPASLSSTIAREAASRGDAHRALPPEVATYIARHGLYRDS